MFDAASRAAEGAVGHRRGRRATDPDTTGWRRPWTPAISSSARAVPVRDRRASRRRAARRRPSWRRTAPSSTSTAASSGSAGRPPPGEARTDFEVINAVAAAMDADLGCPTPAAAMDELAAWPPVRRDLARAARPRGAAALALPSPDDPGRPSCTWRASPPPTGGPASRRPTCRPASSPTPSPVHPGHRAAAGHYNAGTMTRRTANLELLPEERLDINPRRHRAGVGDGDLVEVTSRRGRSRRPGRRH